MKGTIVKCLEELVTAKFGRESWEKSLEDAGLHRATLILPITDVDDAIVMRVVEAVCRSLGLTLSQVADAFGDYWVIVYSQRMYDSFYKRNSTAKDLLLDMNNIHVTMTKTLPNAQPPRFSYTWKNDKTLIIRYQSHRGLIAFAEGLIKGVGKFYNERLRVTVLGNDEIQVVFP